jgi:uncharacterized membrane protein YwzB
MDGQVEMNPMQFVTVSSDNHDQGDRMSLGSLTTSVLDLKSTSRNFDLELSKIKGKDVEEARQMIFKSSVDLIMFETTLSASALVAVGCVLLQALAYAVVFSDHYPTDIVAKVTVQNRICYVIVSVALATNLMNACVSMLSNAGHYFKSLMDDCYTNFRPFKILVILFEFANIVLLVLSSAITIQQQDDPINILLNGTALSMISNLDEIILAALELKEPKHEVLAKMEEGAQKLSPHSKIGVLAALSVLFYVLIDYSSYYHWRLA